ncbi:MAG: TPM domain-containing protein, partial [Burkholderiales bacterium]
MRRAVRAVAGRASSALRRLVAWCGLVALLAAAWPALAQQPVAVPPLSMRVTDLTGTLTAAQRQALEAQLAAIEQRKGAQVAILVVPTTKPEPIEAYGIRVADAWKLGRGRERAQKDTGDTKATAIDDGVIVIVAKNDRRVRIEVGYGLEGAIPDAVAKRIITESITPRFRTGDYAGGLEAAVADIGRRIDGEELPAPWQSGHADGRSGEIEGGLLPMALMAFVGGLLTLALMAFVVGLMISQVAGRFIGAVVGGGGAGVGATAALAATGLGAAVGLGVGLVSLAWGGGRGGGGGGP